MLMKKIKKLVRDPKLYFLDALNNAMQMKSETSDNLLFCFHINDWKKPIIESWFPEKKLVYIPFNPSSKEIKTNWIPKISRTKNSEILVWGKNLPEEFEIFNDKIAYVEDGFIRSIGLGASHTPPISLCFDKKTLYFDAQRASELETLLNEHQFQPDEIERAQNFKKALIDSKISKYNNSNTVDLDSIYGTKTKKRVLVIGQVEDDASIKYGSQKKYTNNDIVTIAHLENPDAEIIYKPHPDVLNGHRKYQSNPSDVKDICHILTIDIPLTQALETIDHVYTITSLSGFEALIRNIKVTTLGCPFYSGWGLTDDRQKNERRNRKLTIEELFYITYILYPKYFDPIYKEYITPEKALDILCDRKKNLNREYQQETKKEVFAFRINDWKRNIIESWFPDHEFKYIPFKLTNEKIRLEWINAIQKSPAAKIFVWGLEIHEDFNIFKERMTFIEDGFIRSIGLGAAHTPPLSLCFDHKTLYFNAREPSDLEDALNNFSFTEDQINRAKSLRNKIINSGISKYNHTNDVDIHSIYGEKRKKRILVIGQVEDDASIKFGSIKKHTNNDLVLMAKLENPDAEIIYKPHPDVLNGFRQYQSNPDDVKHLCKVVTEDIPLAQSFDTIDHIYTITSLSGFEALIRGITVTTVGCPFYSGWGLTDDRQPNPRRKRTLTIDEIFYLAYIHYPKYFHPIYKNEISAEEALQFLIHSKNKLKPQINIEPAHLEGATQNNNADELYSIQTQLSDIHKSIYDLQEKITRKLLENKNA